MPATSSNALMRALVAARDRWARTAADSQRALRMGFGGKLCIHPAQLSTVHQVFAPTDAAVAQAQAIVQAMADAAGGVCTVDGKMVDAPVLQLAQRTLQRYAWAQQRTTQTP